ncbi:MAG: hypothetical protein SNJ79_13675, partial [Sphingomonadaceae bacterium]
WFDQPYRKFFDLVLSGWYVHPKGASTRRSYGYVGNSVVQVLALLEAEDPPPPDEPYHLADYDPVDIGMWAALIAREAGHPRPREVPLALFRAAALAGDAMQRLGYRDPPMTSFRLRNMLTDAVLDTRAPRRLVPTLPKSMEEGVRDTLSWLEARRDGTMPQVVRR